MVVSASAFVSAVASAFAFGWLLLFRLLLLVRLFLLLLSFLPLLLNLLLMLLLILLLLCFCPVLVSLIFERFGAVQVCMLTMLDLTLRGKDPTNCLFFLHRVALQTIFSPCDCAQGLPKKGLVLIQRC